jgi:hypothetical protein
VGQYSKCMLQGYTIDQFLEAISNVLTVGLLELSIKSSFQIKYWAPDDQTRSSTSVKGPAYGRECYHLEKMNGSLFFSSCTLKNGLIANVVPAYKN